LIAAYLAFGGRGGDRLEDSGQAASIRQGGLTAA
jgi:hypothetical protein